jgi:hypothetical protein
MFRITQDPSSGSIDSYLINITRSGTTVLVVCAVSFWGHIIIIIIIIIIIVTVESVTPNNTVFHDLSYFGQCSVVFRNRLRAE